MSLFSPTPFIGPLLPGQDRNKMGMNGFANYQASWGFKGWIASILLLGLGLFFIFFRVWTAASTTDTLGKDTNNEIASEVFILLFVLLLLLGFAYLVSPDSFKNLTDLLRQIGSVGWVIAYTLALIVVFTAVPKDLLTTYAVPIVLGSLLGAVFVFWLALRPPSVDIAAESSYYTRFKSMYEKVRMTILLFCFLVMAALYYIVDPGGLVSKNLGPAFVLTLLLGCFGLLNLTLYAIMHSTTQKANVTPTTYSWIGLFAFLLIFTVSVLYYPDLDGTGNPPGIQNFFKNPTVAIISLSLLIVISLLWLGINIVTMFSISSNSINVNDIHFEGSKRILVYLFSFLLVCLGVAWLVANLSSLILGLTIRMLVLNLLVVAGIAWLLYRTLYPQPLMPFNPNKPHIGNPLQAANEFKTFFNKEILSILVIGVVVTCFYFYYNPLHLPPLYSILSRNRIINLLSHPQSLQTTTTLATYDQLRIDPENPSYAWGLSFYVWIDASDNVSDQFKTILDYYPRVSYCGTTNTLRIAFHEDESDAPIGGGGWQTHNVPLQRWNHIVLNRSDNGLFDIFFNGTLQKTVNLHRVEYNHLVNLQAGQEDGLHGAQIKQVVFSTQQPFGAIEMYLV